MSCKPFKTIDDQIELLKSRGLVVNDYEYAKKVFYNINYYRLSGYTLTLRKDDVFYKKLTLEQIMQIYDFDAELRSLVMFLLERIEVSFRTHISYYHAKKYGPLGYKDKTAFKNEDRFNKIDVEISDLIKRSERNEVFIKHHKENYNGNFPVWVIVELMSFGTLSMFFENLTDDIKREICGQHYQSIPFNYIENWLHGFAILRNICAHRGRLYNRYLTFSPKLSKRDKELFIKNNLNINKEAKKVFSYIYIFSKLIDNKSIVNDFVHKFEELILKYPFVKISHFGFPVEWSKLLQ